MSGTVRLNPGIYQYSFECMLPPELPTSVEGSYGHIRYIVRVVLDFRLHPEIKFEETFTVIKMINLNYDPALRVTKAHYLLIFIVATLCIYQSFSFFGRNRLYPKKIKRFSLASYAAAHPNS